MTLLVFLRVGVLVCSASQRPSLLIIWLVILSVLAGVVVRDIISSWFIYVVVLLFTGGIIVLFVYIRTLTQSRKVSFNSYFWYLWIFFLGLVILFPSTNRTSFRYLELSPIYYLRGRLILLRLAAYLFLVLIIVVKLTSPQQGPLKRIFKNEK